MAAKIGLGTTVAYETTPGSGTYTVVGEVFEVTIPETSMETVDATDFSHTDAHRRKIAGLIELGEASFTLHYDPALTVFTSLDTFYKSRVSRRWRFAYAGSAVNTIIEAFITGMGREVPMDEKMTLAITLTPSGVMTEAAT